MTNKKQEVTEVPAPLAIRQLVELHNVRIREQQEKSLKNIENATVEIMLMMGLNPRDGWRFDMETLKYVKVSTEDITDGNSQVE